MKRAEKKREENISPDGGTHRIVLALLSLLRIRGVELISHELEHILEFHGVGGIGLDQSFVGFKHGLLLGFGRFVFRHGFVKLAIGWHTVGGHPAFSTVKSWSSPRLPSRSALRSLTLITRSPPGPISRKRSATPARVPMKVESICSQSRKIDHEITETTLDHLLDEFLQPGAVLERAAPFHFYPDGAVNATDQDRRCRVHSVERYPSVGRTVKSRPDFYFQMKDWVRPTMRPSTISRARQAVDLAKFEEIVSDDLKIRLKGASWHSGSSAPWPSHSCPERPGGIPVAR